MAESAPQNYSNHTRFDPPFHFFLIPLFAIGVLLALWHLYQSPGIFHLLLVIYAAAFLLLVLKTRLYALKVQDRVIRLEEQLRLSRLLPEPLRGRIGELSVGQLIGLRFAPDAELPALAERALNEKLSRADIKKAVKNWRPDTWRV